jgi:hypothetical protein
MLEPHLYTAYGTFTAASSSVNIFEVTASTHSAHDTGRCWGTRRPPAHPSGAATTRAAASTRAANGDADDDCLGAARGRHLRS